jgi:hypothetical protein
MTTGKQIEANRANARKSTGPQSEAGKAQVARNAVHHGATGQPTASQVSDWFRIITNRSEYRAGSLVTSDDTTRRALALADAEARLVAAETALADLEATEALQVQTELNTVSSAALLQAIATADRSISGETYDQSPPTASDIEELALRFNVVGRRRRLLKRYVREARAQRKRAFRSWLAHLSGSAQTRSRD